MPGQPAWTLTEMLECNLPYVGLEGEIVMWVQPKFWQPIFSLKPIRATTYRFYSKNLRSRAAGFFLEQFFCSRKEA